MVRYLHFVVYVIDPCIAAWLLIMVNPCLLRDSCPNHDLHSTGLRWIEQFDTPKTSNTNRINYVSMVNFIKLSGEPSKTSLFCSFSKRFQTELPNRADFHRPVSTIQGDFKCLGMNQDDKMSRWEAVKGIGRIGIHLLIHIFKEAAISICLMKNLRFFHQIAWDVFFLHVLLNLRISKMYV